jgi:hypothetical protein
LLCRGEARFTPDFRGKPPGVVLEVFISSNRPIQKADRLGMDSAEPEVRPSSELLFHIIRKWGYKPSPDKLANGQRRIATTATPGQRFNLPGCQQLLLLATGKVKLYMQLEFIYWDIFPQFRLASKYFPSSLSRKNGLISLCSANPAANLTAEALCTHNQCRMLGWISGFIFSSISVRKRIVILLTRDRVRIY